MVVPCFVWQMNSPSLHCREIQQVDRRKVIRVFAVFIELTTIRLTATIRCDHSQPQAIRVQA